LDSVAVCYLVAFAILGAAWFFVKPHRAKISLCLVIVLTVYVGSELRQMFVTKAIGKSTPVIEADRAELELKFGSAMSAAMKKMGKLSPSDEKSLHKTITEADDVLDKVCQTNPANATLQACRVVLKHQMNQPIAKPLEYLQHSDPMEGPALAKDLSFAFSTTPQHDLKAAAVIEEDLNNRLPNGWYRTHALGALYRVSEQNEKLAALQKDESEQDFWRFSKMVAVMSVVILCGLAGAIIILVQLIFLGRNVTPPDQVHLIQAPAAYGFKTVYGVFVAWIATLLTVSHAAMAMVQSFKLVHLGVMVAAIMTALLYTLSNAPGLLYIYFCALKPHGIKFLEGVKWRPRVGNLGPWRLVLIGLMTWMAAIPLVVVVFIIAVKCFGSQGSSNPIIALVMQSARSSNILAILIFYFTIGVLAPICEESLFRGFLYSSLRRKFSVLPSMLISAILFAGAHLDAGGFLPLFVLGAIFAFVFERTKSTLPSMVAHGLWNSGTFTLVLLLFGN